VNGEPRRTAFTQAGPASLPAKQGRLVLVVGPSGAGKDSVIDWVRARIESGCAACEVRFARRTITRPAGAGGERHVAVDRAGFERLRTAGSFALDWSANGHSYGIGQEIRTWLAEGRTVVVSGSRGHLPEALRAFPDARVALITASREVLRQRLLARGREAHDEIEARLARADAFTLPAGIAPVEIRNDGLLETAGQSLMAMLGADAPASGETPPAG